MRHWMCPFSINIDNKTGLKLPSRGLKLIGVRFYLYDGKSREDERKARCIQKSLYGKTNWFYFNNGFKINSSLKFEIKAKQFYAASQRVL